MLSENDIQQNLSIAFNKLAEGDANGCLVICKSLIAAQPENRRLVAEAHLASGRAYLLLGQLDISEQELKTCLELDDTLASGYIDLGQVYIRRGLHTQAVSYLIQARKCVITNPKVRINLAFALLGARQFEDAYFELQNLLLSHNPELLHSALYILYGIAWYGKIRWSYRNLIAGPLFLGLLLPPTRVWVWLGITVLVLVILLIFQRSGFLRQAAPPVVFVYLLLTWVFLASVFFLPGFCSIISDIMTQIRYVP